jgi:purine catabolism regulator
LDKGAFWPQGQRLFSHVEASFGVPVTSVAAGTTRSLATLPSVDTFVQELGLESAGAAAGLGRGAEEHEEALRRAVAVQQGLVQPALEGRGLDAVAAAISAAIEGGVLIVGPAGQMLARHGPSGVLTDAVAADLGRDLAARGDGHPCIVAHPELPAGAYARPVLSSRGTTGRGWIVVATADVQIDEPVRLVLRQAAAIVGLELMHRGVVSETERRLTAGLIGDAIAGRTDGDELERRLAAFGIGGEVAVAVLSGAGAEAESALQGVLAAIDVAAAVSSQPIDGRELLCAVVEVGGRDPIELTTEIRRALVEEVGEVDAAVSRARPAAELPRTFQEAYWALGAVEHRAAGGGDHGERASAVGSWHDLGVESLLLAVGDPDVLQLYCDRLLGPVLANDSVYAAELLRSLELFILHNGQWERAARELHCHRHTLRYRIRKIEELTGRDLSKATDRVEFWLALRARELAARSISRPAAG